MIGIFDSGVGGFSVLRPLLEAFPALSFLYLADTAHVPYSNKSPAELEVIVGKILRFFLREKVGAVIFACNTSSALILPEIRRSFPVPAFGVVMPGVKAALESTGGKGIGVAANQVTADSGVFRKLIHRENPGVPVLEQGCPNLVSLVEEGDIDSEKAGRQVREYCKPLVGKIDTLLLGCTHFPFLERHFQGALPEVTLVDPARPLARELQHVLEKETKGAALRKFYATGTPPHVADWAGKVLGWNVKVEPVDLGFYEPWLVPSALQKNG